MVKRKVNINVADYPAKLHGFFQNTDVYDSSSSSEATVLYCDSGYYIKISEKGSLCEEAALGRLFYGLGLGVEVVLSFSEKQDYLVTKSAVGQVLTHYTGPSGHFNTI